MLDAHCHIDLYPNPVAVIEEAAANRVTVVAVTNLPSHYEQGLPHVQGHNHIKFALGLHPLMAAQHHTELARFLQLLPRVSFVGEVGLDFSREGASTADVQMASFRKVLHGLTDRPRFVSLHSRRAEDRMLDLLEEYKVTSAVFHWYTGKMTTLERAVEAGNYFSINPAMISSKTWTNLLARIPRNRILSETDGPYFQIDGISAKPGDVARVLEALALAWNEPVAQVEQRLHQNFGDILKRINNGKQRSGM